MNNKLVFEIIKNGLSDLYRRTGDEVPEELLPGTGVSEKTAKLAEEMAAALEQGHTEPNSQKNVCSIFNRLNGNAGDKKWPGGKKALSGLLLYPETEAAEWSKQDYREIREEILSEIRTYREDCHWVNVCFNVLEDELKYIPALRGNSEISLYEHIKTAAAVGSCLAGFDEKQTEDTKMFLLFSMDVSGIQDFIYTISSKGALKSLRSRSFYLEIMMEHMVDELLEKTGLTRANLVYSGGGHCYILFPNTGDVKRNITNLMNEMNHWFLSNFQISLYVGYGMAECSLNDLRNQPEGKYAEIFREVSSGISQKKIQRYSADEICFLNSYDTEEGLRECVICKRVDRLDDNNYCDVCGSLLRFSRNILTQEYFSVVDKKTEGALMLPGNKYLISGRQENNIRIYRKNCADRENHRAVRIWIGDYSAADTFEELAEESDGIKRLGIYRADVDNLGNAFVAGFRNNKNGKNESSLAATAALSRSLTLFFKNFINQIIDGKNAAIVYSGGDDLFVVGAWNDVLQFALELHTELERYSQNSLTVSGGIGLYPESYPINVMAEEVAHLEDTSKSHPGKNAITLFAPEYCFGWDELREKVLDEKLKGIEAYFDITSDHGKNFIYNLLELIRGCHEEGADKINLVRYVYLLSRMEPEDSKNETEKQAYREFSRKMYQWIQKSEDRKQLIMAIYIYVYKKREREH